jgi:undecaprenyl-phosphate 4-deoxy-4-formamido-L-arabinose transferase
MHRPRETSECELSIVIPVYNGSVTIAPLVDRIHRIFARLNFEVILVNDGSQDESERVCAALAAAYPHTVTFLHLSRNFGEHNAVLAGLNHAAGEYVAVLDDDGQNPPEEVLRMLAELHAKNHDVVYGRYRVKQHGWLRNLGSWFADRMANVMLKKPRGLYLSSFKVMNRFVVNEVTRYRGPFPYIDGLIYRSTCNIGQVDVEHRERQHGRSNYTFGKLVRVWMNMFLNFSILPLRLTTWTGLLFALTSVVALIAIWIEKLQLETSPKPGIRTVLCCVVFFGGLNLLVVGMLGEYLGRLFLDHTGTPQFVVRYIERRRRAGADNDSNTPEHSGTSLVASCAATPPYGLVMETVGDEESLARDLAEVRRIIGPPRLPTETETTPVRPRS